MIKISQPFGKNVRKPQGGDFLTHTVCLSLGPLYTLQNIRISNPGHNMPWAPLCMPKQGCIVVPELGGTPFRQIFLSRNGAAVNIVYHSRNADTAAFRQISSYYKKVTLYTKFGQLVRRKIIEIVATSICHILWLKCTKFDFRFAVEYSR